MGGGISKKKTRKRKRSDGADSYGVDLVPYKRPETKWKKSVEKQLNAIRHSHTLFVLQNDQARVRAVTAILAWSYSGDGLAKSLSVVNSLSLQIYDQSIDYLINEAVDDKGDPMDDATALTILAVWLIREKMF